MTSVAHSKCIEACLLLDYKYLNSNILLNSSDDSFLILISLKHNFFRYLIKKTLDYSNIFGKSTASRSLRHKFYWKNFKFFMPTLLPSLLDWFANHSIFIFKFRRNWVSFWTFFVIDREYTSILDDLLLRMIHARRVFPSHWFCYSLYSYFLVLLWTLARR